MKAKSLSFIIAGIFAFVFLMSAVSAVTLTEWNFDSSDLNPDVGTATLTINAGATADYVAGNPSTGKALSTANWDAEEYYEIAIDLTDYENIILSFDEEISSTGPTEFKIQYSSDGTTFTDLTGSTTSTETSFDTTPMHTFNFSSITSIDNNANAKLRITVPNDAAGNFHLDNLKIEGTEIEDEPITCDYSEGSLNVDIKDIQVIEGFGDDEEWLPFDEVEVEIEVENKNDDEKIKDIELEWGLWSEETDEWVIELDDVDEFDLKKDSEETVTINFKVNEKKLDVDLDELEDGDYTLYVRAKGEEQEDPEFNVCSIDSEEVKIFIESDFVILNDIEVPEVVQCDSEVQITADVWNIGDSDQDEVVVVLYNKELGLSEEIEIGDIDAFDSEPLDFTFQLPKDAEEKTYSLKLTVYDEDHDIYENDYDDEQSIFSVFLKVEGSCSVGEASVNAVLESGGQAGKPLIIKATIVNTGDKSTTYMLNAAGYAEWASTAVLDQNTITLEAGQSKDILLTFQVKKEALGDNLFNLEVLAENELIVSKPVQVTITKRGLGITGGAIFGDNWYLWGIGALNVILVILIIVIAVRIARK